MLLAENKIIPPKEWIHDPRIKNIKNLTVYDILKTKNINVPDEWDYKKALYNNPIKD